MLSSLVSIRLLSIGHNKSYIHVHETQVQSFLQLLHIASKKFLVVNTTKTSRTEHNNLRVSTWTIS